MRLLLVSTEINNKICFMFYFNSNNTQVINIIMLYNEIIKYVTVVYEEFENHIEHVIKLIAFDYF